MNEKIDELNIQVIQNKQEFDFKTRDYQDKIEVFRIKEINVKKLDEKMKNAKIQNSEKFFEANFDGKKKENYKGKLIEVENELVVEKEKFKNLQGMAIADKEKCVQFEIKLTGKGKIIFLF